MEEEYLESVKKQFAYYKLLGEKTFDQLDEKSLFQMVTPESNSIAIIVNHLGGNMLSRWTNFLTADGEKEWRDRDAEFEGIIDTKEAMLIRWDEGWNCLFTALDSINKDNFSTEVYIRNMGHTIVEATNRQLAHYAYHVGQITFIGKMLQGENWNSLSIAKGASSNYNKEKFAQPKRKEHFTQELLKGTSKKEV